MKASSDVRVRELTQVFRETEPRLAGFARKRLMMSGLQAGREDVEDVLSDAYLTTAVRLRRDPTFVVISPEAWIKKVIFFLVLRRAKKRKMEGWAMTIEDLEIQDEALEIVHQARAGEDPDLRTYVQEILASLEARERTVLEQSAEGFSAEEIASQIQSSVENVRQIRSRAARALRKHFHHEHER